jgi:hypothetical protein
MRLVRFILPALLLAAPLHAAESAGSAQWSIGPNLGFSVLSSTDNVPSSFGFGLPSGGGPVFGTVQPGLRLGWLASGGTLEIYADTGMNFTHTSGNSFYAVLNTLNVQRNFSSKTVTTPYVTAGAGFATLGGAGTTQTNAIFGLGFGLRHRVSDGHGVVRAELRYDRLSGTGSNASINSIGVKSGVDLLLR